MSAPVTLPLGQLPLLLASRGEGRALLRQLGIVTEHLGPDREPTVDVIGSAAWDDDLPQEDLDHLAAVFVGVQLATHRVTFVADHDPRRTVAFLAGDAVTVAIPVAQGGFSPQLLPATEVVPVVRQLVVEAESAAVHWSLSRWQGDVRQAVAREACGQILLGGSESDRVDDARSAGNLGELVGAILR